MENAALKSSVQKIKQENSNLQSAVNVVVEENLKLRGDVDLLLSKDADSERKRGDLELRLEIVERFKRENVKCATDDRERILKLERHSHGRNLRFCLNRFDLLKLVQIPRFGS